MNTFITRNTCITSSTDKVEVEKNDLWEAVGSFAEQTALCKHSLPKAHDDKEVNKIMTPYPTTFEQQWSHGMNLLALSLLFKYDHRAPTPTHNEVEAKQEWISGAAARIVESFSSSPIETSPTDSEERDDADELNGSIHLIRVRCESESEDKEECVEATNDKETHYQEVLVQAEKREETESETKKNEYSNNNAEQPARPRRQLTPSTSTARAA